MTLLPALRGSGVDRADALRVAGRTLSSEALEGCANAVADRIRGARAVAVEATPSIEAMVGMVGALQAGVPLVPVPPLAPAEERRRILRESGADLFLGAAADGTNLPVVPVDLRQRSWATQPEAEPTADAVILYTGGAGGSSRGVRISRRAIATELDLLADAWRWCADDVLVQKAPLFRAYGLVAGLFGALRVGSRFVHLDELPATGPVGTIYLAVPGQWARIARDVPCARALSGARILVSGDAPLAPAVNERIRLLTSHSLIQGYGTTETLIAVTGRADARGTPDTAGIALPGVQTRLLGGDGRPVPADGESVGELSIRGPTLFSGYVGQPDQVTPGDGWHATGDLATVAPDGCHRILGRRRADVVHCRNQAVPARQVEEVLLTHPGVHDVAVVGAPHRALGEMIVAYVVAADGLTAQMLIDHVGRMLSAAHRPRRVYFVAELPRSAQGRVRKSLLIAAG
ncbi:AMP-binding protein [Micromonospora sagamiensis]|uniref:Fatty acid CoA ligase FadD36 n=1 Tax=Micromonospora sagamiensis TaxID=47875 RepID=A0A562WIH1_9ACTN|nr:AMP-binding protein [Micromonospora sagamiensis]TWJ29697.1 fatty acid CoA ligase FadD36 [Micromonospora sagamiensis]BCL17274.1 acyl-CoA synthetase [Micromonospora sagamiensis]